MIIAEPFKINGHEFLTIKEIPLMKIYPCELTWLSKEYKKLIEDRKNTFNKIWNEEYGFWCTPKDLERIKEEEKEITFEDIRKRKKVELIIETEDSNSVLLGELDHFLTKHFRVRSIEVGKENLRYNNQQKKALGRMTHSKETADIFEIPDKKCPDCKSSGRFVGLKNGLFICECGGAVE